MAEHFKFYPDARDTVVPWNARYQFPSQSNKATKVTPRIPPKNGAVFSIPTAPYIRLEFPADGYVNPLNTTIAFDVTLTGFGTPGTSVVRFQNNIQSIFRRVRILYGSTPLEDILDYNRIVRNLTEWTANSPVGTMDGSSIDQGIGNVVAGIRPTVGSGIFNVRQAYIQGIDNAANGHGHVPNGSGQVTNRRYQVNLATGLFTQDKLIPTKFMASQLAIEIELAPPEDCIFVESNAGASGTNPTYTVSNVVLIPEILHFDPAYDEMFLRGLREGGVPIKFASWHTFNFTTGGASNVNLQIQERSRSVKALICTQRRTPSTLLQDSGTTLASSAGVIQQFQWRIGGRYFPAAPVQCTLTPSGSVSNQGAEAWVELEKALNIVGEYRLSQGANALRWGNAYDIGNESDFGERFTGYSSTGVPQYAAETSPFASVKGADCFAASTALEASNGMEISGLNAEEQSDIAFMATYSANQQAGFTLSVYAYFDALLVLRENNVIELIQ